jgi:hypothetical protein
MWNGEQTKAFLDIKRWEIYEVNSITFQIKNLNWYALTVLITLSFHHNVYGYTFSMLFDQIC